MTRNTSPAERPAPTARGPQPGPDAGARPAQRQHHDLHDADAEPHAHPGDPRRVDVSDHDGSAPHEKPQARSAAAAGAPGEHAGNPMDRP